MSHDVEFFLRSYEHMNATTGAEALTRVGLYAALKRRSSTSGLEIWAACLAHEHSFRE